MSPHDPQDRDYEGGFDAWVPEAQGYEADEDNGSCCDDHGQESASGGTYSSLDYGADSTTVYRSPEYDNIAAQGVDPTHSDSPTQSFESAQSHDPQRGLGGRFVGDAVGQGEQWSAAESSAYPAASAAGASAVPEKKSIVSRRRFIQGLAVAGTLGYGVVRGAKPVDRETVESQLASQKAATGDGQAAMTDGQSAQVASPNIDAVLDDFSVDNSYILNAAPVDQRVLVLIEFTGGNDGLSMVVPYGVNAYYDLRPRLAIPAEEVHPIDDVVGLSPALGRLHQRQLATVEGVGPVDGVLSHFEMVERWELGDMRGLGGQRAGFLARLADSVDVGGAVTGLSVAGHTPRFNAVQSSTLALNNLNQLRVLTNDDWIFPRYRSAVRGFGGGPMSDTITTSWSKLFNVGDAINTDIDKVDEESLMFKEGGQLGRQLAMAAAMIKADVGVRVIHASMGGFDTHDGHQGKHQRLMEQFDAAVDGFVQEINNAGMGDRVLVATSSEFGRRVRENGSGLDHGAASSMLLLGPVKAGRHGDPSPLGDLDGNGNLRTTIAFDRYLASLAEEWMGVEAASVLPESPQPLGLF